MKLFVMTVIYVNGNVYIVEKEEIQIQEVG
eukprot:SAG11_NODE_1301_length_5259_cov_8.758140_2_plen_30_part_00